MWNIYRYDGTQAVVGQGDQFQLKGSKDGARKIEVLTYGIRSWSAVIFQSMHTTAWQGTLLSIWYMPILVDSNRALSSYCLQKRCDSQPGLTYCKPISLGSCRFQRMDSIINYYVPGSLKPYSCGLSFSSQFIIILALQLCTFTSSNL